MQNIKTMNIFNVIYESNRDLLQRFKEEKISSKYLKNEDVFRVFLGKPRQSRAITVANGLLIVHYNPKNYKIYGFTVPYVKEFMKYCQQFDKYKDIASEFKEKRDSNFLAEPVANAGMATLSFAC